MHRRKGDHNPASGGRGLLAGGRPERKMPAEAPATDIRETNHGNLREPMDYFSILNLDREPFSNSPDPAYFYHSRLHVGCLQKLELSLRLRRGLNVVIGAVGTGKTTLCRQLIQRFAEEDDFETHLVLDPDFPDASSFLAAIASMICGPPGHDGDWEKKERIKAALFEKGVAQGRTVVLIVDEGQKIRPACLEILRELLNYETNEAKLLQIVIFAQTEFESILADRENLADRINLFHRLGPLGFMETRRMIHYRLRQAGRATGAESLFTMPGLWAVYRATGGYPRKVVHLCHKAVLATIIQNRGRAGWLLVRSCARRGIVRSRRRAARRWAWMGATVLLAAMVMAGYGIDFTPWHRFALGPGPVSSPPITRKPVPDPPERQNRETPGAPLASVAPAVSSPAHRKPLLPGPDKENPVAAKNVFQKDAPARGPEPLTVAGAVAPNVDMAASLPAGAGPAVAEIAAGTLERAPVRIRGATAVAGMVPGAAAASLPPESLGKSALEKYETLSWMMIKIYGDYSNALRRKVARANPHIHDPDTIAVGQPIRFPAVIAPVRHQSRTGCWIQLKDVGRLDQAFGLIRRYPSDAPAIRMVPRWNRGEGIRYAVVMWTRFSDEAEARRQIDRLPRELGRGCRVVHAWGRDDLFFADPYQVR